MNKNQPSILFYIITTFALIVAFVVLSPKTASNLFHYKNNSLVNEFIQNTVKNKKVDVRAFWKLREFYCPGSFTFDRNSQTFLKYSCDWLQSSDGLVLSPNLPKNNSVSKANILFSDQKTLIYKAGNSVSIEFVFDTNEMQKANGFFDYKEIDKDLVKDKYWINSTILQ